MAKDKGGRPRKFATPEDFEKLADVYFESCLRDDEVVTWTGLCLAVGMCSRQSLEPYKNGEYDTDDVKFSDSIKIALTRVELEYEKRLILDGGAGPIFALKNFGWRDRQEIDLDAKVTTTTESVLEQGRKRAAERNKPDA